MNEKLAKEAVPKPVPTMHTATIELAQKAYNSGQFKESVLFLETVPEELQHNADAFLLLAKSHEALGNNEIASSLYEQLSQNIPHSIQITFNHVRFLTKLNNLERAYAIYKRHKKHNHKSDLFSALLLDNIRNRRALLHEFMIAAESDGHTYITDISAWKNASTNISDAFALAIKTMNNLDILRPRYLRKAQTAKSASEHLGYTSKCPVDTQSEDYSRKLLEPRSSITSEDLVDFATMTIRSLLKGVKR